MRASEVEAFHWRVGSVVAAGLLALSLAPMASASLSGSYTHYDCADCYVEGTSQSFCFDAHTSTDDGEWAESLWMRFPDDWEVSAITDSGPHACDDASTVWGSMSWSYHDGNLHEVRIDHQRQHGYLDHCSTTYCVTATSGPASGPVHVSWYWADPSATGYPPHYVGSDDGYAPSGWSLAQEDSVPPAYLPHCSPRVLLIQDTLPGGYDAWQTELTALGHFYDEIYSSEIAYTDFGEYDLVITSSFQDGAYHQDINNNLTQFEDYISAGGRVFYAAASDVGSTPYMDAPFGGTYFYDEENYDTIAEVDHPTMVDLTNMIGPNYYTSYGYYAYLPAEATEINNQLGTGFASLHEVRSEQGIVLISTQALEEAYSTDLDFGSVLVAGLSYLLGYAVWDVDGDGFGDCHDNCQDDYNPWQEDLDGDGVGDDCDSCSDGDGDGFGNVISDTSGCPSGTEPDCDDADADVYPGLAEWYDGKDNDCNDLYDDGVLPANALIITEVMKAPGVVGDTVGEWFEVYNNSGYTMNAVGLEVTDTSTNEFSVDSDLWIDPYGYATFVRNGDAGVNGGVVADFEYSNFQLDNAEDEIILAHAGVELDRIEYDDGVTWPDPDGASMSLDIGMYDISLNDDGASWCVSRDVFGDGDYGTPGLANPVCCDDADGDGYYDVACTGDDCDDTNPAINPGETEACDFVDNDCDGYLDEGFDVDADGYTTCDGDCNDSDASIHPAAAEVCDGIDHDCDGVAVAENAVGCADYYLDADDDLYGVTGDSLCLCAPEEPYDALVDGDCDDADALANPGLAESCDGMDNNCDGYVDEGFDVDVDGYTTCEGDCNDWDATVNPVAQEVCDGQDNNCDGTVDEDEAVDALTWYADQDGDGYGSTLDPTVACQGPLGYVADNTDCDDGDPSVSPGAPEICDGQDNDCNPATDEATDSDGDGFTVCSGDCDETDAALNPVDYDGDGESSCDGDCDDSDPAVNTDDVDGDGYSSCDGDCDDSDPTIGPEDSDGDGYSTCNGDCNDNNDQVAPGMLEECDGLDNDCDAATDELVDDDGDGFTECDGDCADDDASVFPTALELCDGIDNDCDPATDEYDDDDGDGQTECQGDCDDTDFTVSQGATEVCDGLDNDCDGYLDPAEADNDADGYLLCIDDCDDFDDLTYPGAPEQCDGRDNDCDTLVDEDVSTDDDGDGFSECQDDCDDTDPAVNPAAVEQCNDGVDDNCDGELYPWEEDLDGDGWFNCEGDCDDNDPNLNLDDADGDGWTTCEGDCDDENASVAPGHEEVCDGMDNDCNGVPGTGESDADGDGSMLCDGDCDDYDSSAYPGADELCDEVDNDCDGDIDEDDVCAGDDDSADDDDSASMDDDDDCQCRTYTEATPPAASPALMLGLIGLFALRRRR